MKLSEQQADFLKMVVDMLSHIQLPNCLIKVTEWNRTLEQQREYFNSGRSHTLNSKHLSGLAVDLGVIKNGKFSQTKKDYQPLGDYWISIGGKWGGEFVLLDDPYHFEYDLGRRQQFLNLG